jgi:hypothetical protein
MKENHICGPNAHCDTECMDAYYEAISSPNNNELIGAAYCALNAFNFAEYIQNYTMFFGASKSEVDSVINYATIIKTLKNLGYIHIRNQDLVMINNCVLALTKGKK